MQVVKMLDHHKSIQRSYERARGFTEKALSLIGTFPDSPAQQALRDIVDLVTAREA
jgi:geranylgeranyl pyrophosphate synthase